MNHRDKMDFCNKCIEGDCIDHKWFTDLRLKNKDDILIADLNHIIDAQIINKIINVSFLVDSQIDIFKYYRFMNYMDGELIFHINVPTSAKLNDFYVPVSCYKKQDEIVDYKIEIIVSIMRHTPIALKVFDNIFKENLLHEVHLINFTDNLHISMEEFHEMVDLAISRLNKYIENLKSLSENLQ